MGKRDDGLGLLLVGSPEEAALSAEAAAEWRGPVINLCGVTNPRETAALLERAELFVGHDSGPMHLAAAMGTRCVAVFSARQQPRIWFPYGDGHRVIFHHMPCEGCRLERCVEFQKQCITSVRVEEMYTAVSTALNKSLSTPRRSSSL